MLPPKNHLMEIDNHWVAYLLDHLKDHPVFQILAPKTFFESLKYQEHSCL